MVFAALVFAVTTTNANIFAQNVSQAANQTGEKFHTALNQTGEATQNATELDKTMNKTGETIKNFSGNVVEGLKDLFNGSSKQ